GVGKLIQRQRHRRPRDVAGRMRIPSIRKDVICAATLMIKTERVGSRQSRGGLIADPERKRSAQSGDAQSILAGRSQFRKISFENVFVTSKRKAFVRARFELACESNFIFWRSND